MNAALRKVLVFSAVFLCILLVIFGFQFASVWTAVIFAVIFCAVSLPLEILASAIPRALFELRKLSGRAAQILFLVLDAAATIGALALMDFFMHDVSILPISALIIALVLAFLSLNDFTEKLAEKKEGVEQVMPQSGKRARQ